MAILDKLPSLDIISGFKRALDFYSWKGIPVVRSWPKWRLKSRSPAVTAAGVDFKDTVIALSALPRALQLETRAMYLGSTWTWRDAWLSALYGHNISWAPAAGGGSGANPDENNMIIDINRIFNNTEFFNDINSVNYMTRDQHEFVIPGSVVAYTRYRIISRSRASNAGTTIDLRIAKRADLADPLGDGTPDITHTSTEATIDSGWKTINADVSLDEIWALSFKGSTATTDIFTRLITIILST